MSNIFESMFIREPEQILCGDYYFKNPDIPGFDNAYLETIGIGTDPQEAQEKCKDKCKSIRECIWCRKHMPHLVKRHKPHT